MSIDLLKEFSEMLYSETCPEMLTLSNGQQITEGFGTFRGVEPSLSFKVKEKYCSIVEQRLLQLGYVLRWLNDEVCEFHFPKPKTER